MQWYAHVHVHLYRCMCTSSCKSSHSQPMHYRKDQLMNQEVYWFGLLWDHLPGPGHLSNIFQLFWVRQTWPDSLGLSKHSKNLWIACAQLRRCTGICFSVCHGHCGLRRQWLVHCYETEEVKQLLIGDLKGWWEAMLFGIFVAWQAYMPELV